MGTFSYLSPQLLVLHHKPFILVWNLNQLLTFNEVTLHKLSLRQIFKTVLADDHRLSILHTIICLMQLQVIYCALAVLTLLRHTLCLVRHKVILMNHWFTLLVILAFNSIVATVGLVVCDLPICHNLLTLNESTFDLDHTEWLFGLFMRWLKFKFGAA